MPMHTPTLPTPINHTEAIFEAFWDPQSTPLAKYKFECDPHTAGSANAFWFGTMFKWERGAPGGGVVVRFSREVDWDVTAYDRLHLCINIPATSRLSVFVVVNNVKQVVITDGPGENNFVEYDGPISGQRITHVELLVHDSADAPGVSRLLWLGVFNAAGRAAMRATPNPFEHTLDKFLLPADQAIDAAPVLGLYFDKGDLASLRRKAASPAYAPLMNQFREKVEAKRHSEPWRGIGRFPNEGGPRCGRPTVEAIDPLMMRLGALVGLIDNDAGLMRMALRHALAMAHCEYWFPDFLEAFPGGSFEQRAFFDYRYGTNVVYAWDWAGAFLTPAGKNLLAHAVSHKAMPRIYMTLMRHPYIRTCNQGAYMSYGAIVCQAALSKVWRHGGDYLQPSIDALDETMNTYIAPDGGAFEGMGYVSSTIGHALAAYQLVARLRGVPLKDVVPPRVVRSADYLGAMLSTAPPVGGAINVADGGRPGSTLYPECLPFLCRLSDGPTMPALFSAMLTQPLSESFATPGSAFSLLFGPEPESLPAPAAQPPVFHVLEHTGQLCSCRPTPDGPVRFQLIGAPASAGHTHEDKGSFVIEAFGEEIAIDRGQMAYSDPRCSVISAARYHNLLVPIDAEDHPIHQILPCPSAVLPSGRGDAESLSAHVDASGAWGPKVRKWTRQVESREPTVFEVLDEMELGEATSVAFYVHSRFPWTREGDGWATAGRRARLIVTTSWVPCSFFVGEDFIDGSKSPAYTLAIRTQPALQHRLATRLLLSTVKP